MGLPLPPEGTNVVSAAVFPASGEAEPQGTIPGVQHVYGILSEQQARPGVIRPAEYAPSKVLPNPCSARFYRCGICGNVHVFTLAR